MIYEPERQTYREKIIEALKHTDMTSSELAKWCGTSVNTISNNVQRMAKEGIVNRPKRTGRWKLGTGITYAYGGRERVPTKPVVREQIEEGHYVVRFGIGHKSARGQTHGMAGRSQGGSALNSIFI